MTNPDEQLLNGLKVLVVDDSDDNRFLIVRLLKKRGATVDEAADGHQGVSKALEGDFSIVLMDIQMPGLDGYEATQKLRASGYSTPIIALTAHATSEARDKCLEAGCTTHVTKPVSTVELCDKIVAHTRR